MPIAYGQVKGRKYNNVQRLPEEEKPKKSVRKTCAKCGELKLSSEFATRHFCQECMDEIETKCIMDRLGGE